MEIEPIERATVVDVVDDVEGDKISMSECFYRIYKDMHR